MIGAAFAHVGAINLQGTAYLYKYNGSVFVPVRKIDDDNAISSGRFGFSVGISGFNLIIGTRYKNGEKGEVSFLNFE